MTQHEDIVESMFLAMAGQYTVSLTHLDVASGIHYSKQTAFPPFFDSCTDK